MEKNSMISESKSKETKKNRKSNKSKKSIISAILLAAMVTMSSSIIACNSKDEGNTSNTTSANASVASVNDTDAGLSDKILPNLPDATYGGYEFKILISGNSELSNLRNDFHAEEENGEVINDARYARNVAIEEKYNIKIKDIEVAAGSDNGYNEMKKTVSSGDGAYDAAMIAGYAACKLASEGILWDLNDLEPLDLKNPWWDQKANEDLTIKGKMFYTTGDISTANNDATYCILFNKGLARDYGIENLYELVKSGKWTMDKFVEIASTVSGDLNGDGVYDTEDLYGALIWDDTMMGIVNAAGEKCATITPSGEIELTLYNDKVLSMFEKYTTFAYNNQVAHTYQRKNWDGVASNAMFANNQSLFYLQLLTLVTDMRSMDTDFGILPYPKYSEEQTSYYSTVGSWHSVFLCVPISQQEPERTGVILEALAAESKYTVKPAYYEIALKGKHVRDEESLEMLDIILSTRTYDVGWYYAIGGYNEEIMNLLRNFRSDFTSMYERNAVKAQKQIDTLNETFESVLD